MGKHDNRRSMKMRRKISQRKMLARKAKHTATATAAGGKARAEAAPKAAAAKPKVVKVKKAAVAGAPEGAAQP